MTAPRRRWFSLRELFAVTAFAAVILGDYVRCVQNPMLWWSGTFGGDMIFVGGLMAVVTAASIAVSAIRRHAR